MLELSVEVCVDAKRLHSLIILDLRGALPLIRVLGLTHAHEGLPVIVATHDISAG